MRILGIDYGTKRIGVALGDTSATVATPWAIIEKEGLRNQVDAVRAMVDAEKAVALVVGIPYSMGGEEGEQVEITRAFIDALRLEGLTVHEFDERHSSRIAAVQAAEGGRRGPKDDLAAAEILQSWLDRYGISP